MCKWGTDVRVLVKVAAHLSSTGEEKWREFGIDSCIAPLVKALQEGGIDMFASCCGHEKGPGRIDLADGRVLKIHASTCAVADYRPCDCEEAAPAEPPNLAPVERDQPCSGQCYSEFEEGRACSRHGRPAPV